jgi:hypothetical protein
MGQKIEFPDQEMKIFSPDFEQKITSFADMLPDNLKAAFK